MTPEQIEEIRARNEARRRAGKCPCEDCTDINESADDIDALLAEVDRLRAALNHPATVTNAFGATGWRWCCDLHRMNHTPEVHDDNP